MGARLLNDIVKRADLLSVRPTFISVSRGRGQSSDAELSLDSSCSYETDDERRTLTVVYTYEIRQEQKRDAAVDGGFRATSTYELTYAFDPPLTERYAADLETFAVDTGRFNSWPYLRTFLSHVTAEMELPVLMLPLLKFPASQKRPERRRRTSS